jgi:phosphate uptake regulator
LSKKLDEEIIECLDEMSSIAVSMFETAIEALFRQDYALAESIVEKIKDVISLEKEAVISSQKMDIKEAPYLRLIIESIRRTAEYASDIAEIVLNLTVESILA